MQLHPHLGSSIGLLAAVMDAKRRPVSAGPAEPRGFAGYTHEELANLYFPMMMKLIVTLVILLGGMGIMIVGQFHADATIPKLICGLMGAVVGYWMR